MVSVYFIHGWVWHLFLLHFLFSVVFQAIFIPLGICNGGGYSKGPRGKDPALDAACKRMCIANKQYDGGKCPSGGGFGGPRDCPPECIREMSPVGVWVGSAIQVLIMVGVEMMNRLSAPHFLTACLSQVYLGYIIWSVWQRCKDSSECCMPHHAVVMSPAEFASLTRIRLAPSRLRPPRIRAHSRKEFSRNSGRVRLRPSASGGGH
jgi:hypothetical protein